MILHRKGKEFKDDGKALVYQPGQEHVFKVKCKKRLEYLRATNPTAFNDLASKVLIDLVKFLIEENGGQPVLISEVVQEGSFEIGVNLETIRRYLVTHTARRAELRRDGKRVKLNPYYKPDDEEDDGESE